MSWRSVVITLSQSGASGNTTTQQPDQPAASFHWRCRLYGRLQPSHTVSYYRTSTETTMKGTNGSFTAWNCRVWATILNSTRMRIAVRDVTYISRNKTNALLEHYCPPNQLTPLTSAGAWFVFYGSLPRKHCGALLVSYRFETILGRRVVLFSSFSSGGLVRTIHRLVYMYEPRTTSTTTTMTTDDDNDDVDCCCCYYYTEMSNKIAREKFIEQ